MPRQIYNVKIERAAIKDLKKLDKKIQKQIWPKIVNLASNPRPHGYQPVENIKNGFRIRSGKYRILYTIEDNILTVCVIRVRTRDKAYS